MAEAHERHFAEVLEALDRYRAGLCPAMAAMLDQLDAGVSESFANYDVALDDSHARAGLLALLLVRPPERTPVHVAIAACLGRHIDS